MMENHTTGESWNFPARSRRIGRGKINKEALKKVASDDQARRNQMKKRSLQAVNEHFESGFNTA
ncbi:MAG: hypothetical protein E6Q59_02985 [Nitrosomonas sp.]|nr:MAG: hypothetical protein BVN30_05300 [Proteobacteria bacterium ST_bin16]TXI40844.1 MAG: hypothetical protein E6Q59_02985 [Nitrosomonas sp.]